MNLHRIASVISGALLVVYLTMLLSVSWLEPDEPAVRLDMSATSFGWIPGMCGVAIIIVSALTALAATTMRPLWRWVCSVTAAAMAAVVSIISTAWVIFLAPSRGFGPSVVYSGEVGTYVPDAFYWVIGVSWLTTAALVLAAFTFPPLNPAGPQVPVQQGGYPTEWQPVPGQYPVNAPMPVDANSGQMVYAYDVNAGPDVLHSTTLQTTERVMRDDRQELQS